MFGITVCVLNMCLPHAPMKWWGWGWGGLLFKLKEPHRGRKQNLPCCWEKLHKRHWSTERELEGGATATIVFQLAHREPGKHVSVPTGMAAWRGWQADKLGTPLLATPPILMLYAMTLCSYMDRPVLGFFGS